MIRNKKRLGNILVAGTLTLLLWAVFAMFGQGLAPLPESGNFNLVAWAQQRVEQVEEALQPEKTPEMRTEAEEIEADEAFEAPEIYEWEQPEGEDEKYEAHHEAENDYDDDEHEYEGYEDDD